MADEMRWFARQRAEHNSVERAAEVLRRQFPDVVAGVIAQAELAAKGMLVLPGTGGKPMFVGDPPRWLENPVNDAEYLWLLNRMEHWTTLLRAWALSGEERFAEKVAAELEDWLRAAPLPAHPTCDGDDLNPQSVHGRFNRLTPWRMLEVGIRMYTSWSDIPRFLAGTKWLTGDRAERFAASVAEHGRVLSRYSPILWPGADHNHYMMEMLGLLHVALMLPELPEAAAWREQAVRELIRCCEHQFTLGGGQIEGCPHYHNVCLEVLARAVRALREHGQTIPMPLETAMRHGMEYAIQATRPNGQVVPWGDSDPLSVAGTAVQAAWALGDAEYLRLAAQLAGAEAVRCAIGGNAWDVGDMEGMLAELGRAPKRLPPLVAWHRGLNQVSARTSWERDAASVFFACRSPVNNGHAHIDPGGFDYMALGKPLLVDPARFTYREDADRYWFKSAAVHNTLTIDGRDPFEYRNTWTFGPQQRGVIVSVKEDAGQVMMVAEQENYRPAVHRRTLILRPDGILVVVDRISNLTKGQTVQRWFHFSSTSVGWDVSRQVARTADDVNVAVYAMGGDRGSLHAGRISTVIDVAYPSQRLRLGNVADGAEFVAAAVVVPYREKIPAVEEIRCTGTEVSFVLDGVECRHGI